MSNPYSIKGVKQFMGMEGMGFNCTLYRDGKKVAFVIDSAQGGEYEYRFVNKEEDTKLREYAATLPKYEIDGLGMCQPNSDSVIANLIDDWDENRTLKRLCKNKTVVKLKGEDSYRVAKVLYSQKTRNFLVTKYGDKIEEILNDRFVTVPVESTCSRKICATW